MRKVVIVVDTARGWGRKFLRGVEQYISARGDWIVRVRDPWYVCGNDKGSWLGLENADGIIAGDIDFIEQAMRLDIPKILHDARLDKIPGASTMYTDSLKAGKMAADYFLTLGFKNCAFCGFDGLVWSDKRLKGFSSELANAGIEKIYNYSDWKPAGSGIEAERDNLSQWLSSLPKPVCVFACNDDRGIQVLEACQNTKLRVPEDVAVLGVDNDELMCDISSPPLSSIELNFCKAGYEAAKLLDQIISDQRIERDIIVEPVMTVERQSTDVFAIDDEDLIKALAFIRQNYHKPIQVSDVLQSTTASRRSLEVRFRKILKRSIKDEILRLRVDSLKRRLANTNEPLHSIAKSLSYTDPEHFSRFFKMATGISPSKYRLGLQN